MSNQGTSSSSRLLMVGAAVLLVGVILVLIILRNGSSDTPEPRETVTVTEAPAAAGPGRSELVLPEQSRVARLGDITPPDGHETIAVQMGFVRGVAAVVQAGDRVALYQLPGPSEDDAALLPTSAPLLRDVTVLGVIGPLPSNNEGTLTFLLAIPGGSVQRVMEVANAGELWATLTAVATPAEAAPTASETPTS